MKDKKCAVCGDSFTPTSGRQKYCSDICKGDAVREQTNKRAAKFYKKNKKEILEKNKQIAEQRREYMKQYSQTSTFKSAKRRHYQNNKEYYHNKVKEYRERNKKNKSET